MHCHQFANQYAFGNYHRHRRCVHVPRICGNVLFFCVCRAIHQHSSYFFPLEVACVIVCGRRMRDVLDEIVCWHSFLRR